MSTRDATAAWRYHDGTKHSPASLRAHPHYLDWDIKPLPFKIYPRLEPIPLPRELPPSSVRALDAIGRSPISPGGAPRRLNVTELARLLYFSAGITRKKVYPDGQVHHFRAAACTGALYHIDLYVICGDLEGLAAGVYQFGPHDFSLYRLRSGDHRGVLVGATGAAPSVAHALATIVCVSTYWRNAWKYQARAYRHCFWDSGTLLANLLAVAAADEVPSEIVAGFVDETVGALLGLDPQREAPLTLVALGHQQEAIPPSTSVPAIALETLPLSSEEVDYAAIRETQAASSLQTPEEVRAWRASTAVLPVAAPLEQATALRPLADTALPVEAIDSVITRRGSSRQFVHTPITFAQLSTILHSATRGVAADYGFVPIDLYLIVNAVEGLAAGAYVYRRDSAALELLRAGNFRRDAGYLGLGQDLPADASVNIYMLCDLDPVLQRLGSRGYRVAQLDAAITGGKLYLAAYALRLGATGLTFFDDDVTEFFSPHAAGKGVMFLMALGKSRRNRAITEEAR